MNKKLDLKITILAALNLIICLCVIIFASPKHIPLFFDLNENVSLLGSKWFLLACIIIPTALAIAVNLTQNKQALNFFLKMLFVVCLYENMLIMITVSATNTFVTNTQSEVPMSLVFFLPIAGMMTIGAIKIKHLPFKAFSPFKNKYSMSDEFIWKQTHIFARDALFATGLLNLIATLILAIFRLLIVNFILLVLGIIILYALVIRESKLMNQKRSEMQAKKDRLDKEKPSKSAN